MSEDKDTKDIEKMVEEQAKQGGIEAPESEKDGTVEGALDSRRNKGTRTGYAYIKD